MTNRPRLLDLYCGAGGAAVGYHRAGFDIVGVDIAPQPNYPFEFVQADALHHTRSWLDALAVLGKTATWDFDAIHASPPCQAHSTIAKQSRKQGWTANEHPDLVAPTRELLQAAGLPYVIENVPGAPLIDPVLICGSMFDPPMEVRRHRLFEVNWPLNPPMWPCRHKLQAPRFPTADSRRQGKFKSVVEVTGTGRKQRAPVAGCVTVAGHLGNFENERELREWAMQIDWMSPYELTQAIPPTYTEFIGAQLLTHVSVAA